MSDIKNKDTSEDLWEMYNDSSKYPFEAMTFSDLDSIDKSGDVIENLQILQYVTQNMLYNISNYSPDKVAKARQLIKESFDMANAVLDEYSNGEDSENDKENKEKRSGILTKVKIIVGKVKSFLSKNKNAEMLTKDNGQSLFIWKDKNGGLRWFARYSNNYRDDDNPAEIIAKESHINFVDMVDKGLADYPELEHWHIPGSEWGKADWIAFDEDTGVAMASGIVYEGHEKEAEALASSSDPIGVSHGMPTESIARDSLDSSIIVRHVTKEISDLPLRAAANKLTSFTILLKEIEMGIPANKKEYLKQLGMSDDQIASIEAGNASVAKSAAEAGIESKEKTEETTPVDAEKAETPANKEQEPTLVGAEQLADVVKQMTDAFGEALKAMHSEIIAQVKSEIDSVKTELTKEKEARESLNIPAASLSAMIAQRLSSVGSVETQVRKNDPIVKSGPIETESDGNKVVNTGNPIMDTVISNIIGKRS